MLGRACQLMWAWAELLRPNHEERAAAAHRCPPGPSPQANPLFSYVNPLFSNGADDWEAVGSQENDGAVGNACTALPLHSNGRAAAALDGGRLSAFLLRAVQAPLVLSALCGLESCGLHPLGELAPDGTACFSVDYTIAGQLTVHHL